MDCATVQFGLSAWAEWILTFVFGAAVAFAAPRGGVLQPREGGMAMAIFPQDASPRRREGNGHPKDEGQDPLSPRLKMPTARCLLR
eukprot:15147468-Alexandrium_andersonii.AAC.1